MDMSSPDQPTQDGGTTNKECYDYIKSKLTTTENNQQKIIGTLDEVFKRLDSLQNSDRDTYSKKTGSSGLWNFITGRKKETLLLKFFQPIKNEVCGDLLKELKTRFKPGKCEISLEECKAPQDKFDTPLLVLCMSISRTSVDIENALKMINRDNFIIVLLVHMKEAHALPKEETALDPQCEYVKHVIDVAYRSEKGLYDCEMNRRALVTLERVLHSVR